MNRTRMMAKQLDQGVFVGLWRSQASRTLLAGAHNFQALISLSPEEEIEHFLTPKFPIILHDIIKYYCCQVEII